MTVATGNSPCLPPHLLHFPNDNVQEGTPRHRYEQPQMEANLCNSQPNTLQNILKNVMLDIHGEDLYLNDNISGRKGIIAYVHVPGLTSRV